MPKIKKPLKYLNELDPAASTKYSSNNVPLSVDVERCVRGLVVLFDALDIDKFGSDLDCTVTNKHTMVIKDQLPGIYAAGRPDGLYASDAIRYLFYRLKQDLAATNGLITFQGFDITNQVVKFGDMHENLDHIYSGINPRTSQDAVNSTLAKMGLRQDQIAKTKRYGMHDENSHKKYHALLDIFGGEENLKHAAFFSDFDLDVTRWLKEKGAFTFGGDGRGEELPEVERDGEVQKGKGDIGFTVARLKQMGVKLINEIEGKGIRIPDEVYNALAPIFEVSERKLKFGITGDGVYESVGVRPGFSVGGKNLGLLTSDGVGAAPPVPPRKKWFNSAASTAPVDVPVIESLLDLIEDLAAKIEDDIKITKESGGDISINFSRALKVNVRGGDLFVSGLKFKNLKTQEVALEIHYDSQVITMNLSQSQGANPHLAKDICRAINEKMTRRLQGSSEEQNGDLGQEFSEVEMALVTHGRQPEVARSATNSNSGQITYVGDEGDEPSSENGQEAAPEPEYQKVNLEEKRRQRELNKVKTTVFANKKDDVFSNRENVPEDDGASVASEDEDGLPQEAATKKVAGRPPFPTPDSAAADDEFGFSDGDASEDQWSGGEDEKVVEEAATASPKKEQPLLEQLKELLVQTLPGDETSENRKVVRSINPKEVWRLGTVNKNRFVFDPQLTISALPNLGPIAPGEKKVPMATNFDVAKVFVGTKSDKRPGVVVISELSFEQEGGGLTALTIKTSQPKGEAKYVVGMSAYDEIAKMVQEIVSQVRDKLQMETGVTKAKSVAEIYEGGAGTSGGLELPQTTSSVGVLATGTWTPEVYDLTNKGSQPSFEGMTGNGRKGLLLKNIFLPGGNPKSTSGGSAGVSDDALLDDDLFTEPSPLPITASQLRDYCQMYNTLLGSNDADFGGAVGIENLGQTFDVGQDQDGKPLYQVSSLEHDSQTYHTVTVCVKGRPVGLRYEIPISGDDFTLTKTEKTQAEYSFDRSHSVVGDKDGENLRELGEILDALAQDPRVSGIAAETETDAPASAAAATSHQPLDKGVQRGGGRGGSSNAGLGLGRGSETTSPPVGVTITLPNGYESTQL